MGRLGLALVQMGIVTLLAPLVTGLVQKVKARLQARRGAGILQPYRDLAKLLRKSTVRSDSASGFFEAVPVLVLAATLVAAAMVPVLWMPAAGVAGHVTQRGAPDAFGLPLGDAIMLLSFLALGRFLSAVGALDAGGAFGGMGASREMTLGVLAEPVLMLIVFSVAVAAGTTDLGDVASWRALAPLSFRPPDLLALFAMLVLLIVETGRIPVDNPDTHLELTMLHEGMLLEHSGPGLACMLLATHVKQLVVMALCTALFVPAGLATAFDAPAVAIAIAAFIGKTLVLVLFLAIVESSYAKLRLFRLPHFLGLGFVSAFLALALRILALRIL